MIIGTPFLAYGVYLFLKLVGYTFAAFLFKKLYGKPEISARTVGIARTIVGVVVGGAFTGIFSILAAKGVFSGLPPSGGRGAGVFIWYIGALIPIRMFEWAGILWFFFDRKFERKALMLGAVLIGMVISYVIDIPVLIGVFFMVASIC